MTEDNRRELVSEKLLELLRLIDYWPGWIDYFREHFEDMEKDDPPYQSDEERREAEKASRIIRTAAKRLVDAKREPTLMSTSDQVTRVLRDIVSDTEIDQVFTVEALSIVLGALSRWKKLEDLHVGSLPGERVTRYLRQATTCYLWGLPDAAAVLCRAGLESALLEALAGRLGGAMPQEPNLEALINFAHTSRILDDEMAGKAHRIRRVGNDAVHKISCSEQEARLQILETADVLQRIYGGSGRA